MRQYLGITSLREYVLVAQDEMSVDHLHRAPGGSWAIDFLSEPADVLRLRSVPVSMALSDIYRDVTFEADDYRHTEAPGDAGTGGGDR